MNKLYALILMCPLSVAAADWRYDGQAVAGSSTGEANMETSSSSMAMSPAAGPAPASAPGNNMTMTGVRAANGEPERVLDGVGEPPITRWQYPGYVVYFERDRVITSVAGSW